MRRCRYSCLFFFLIFFWAVDSRAQARVDQTVYEYVKNIHLENHDLDRLVRDLTSNYSTDELKKAESIYLWIKLNFSFDFFKFSGMHTDLGYDTTVNIDNFLRDSIGVAEDFSLLAKAMFEKASIPCKIINGWAKGGVEETIGYINNNTHVWNAIKLQNKWRLLDCTWSSLDLIRGDSSDFYFLTPPDQFIYSHYPRDAEWKLTDLSINLDQFKQLPYVKPLLFSYIEGTIPAKGHIHTKSKYIYIDTFVHMDSSIVFLLINRKNGTTLTTPIQDVSIGRTRKYRVAVPYPGDWLFQIGVYLPGPGKKKWFHGFVCFFVNYEP